jgi:AcrR family transcriptional regulator
MARRKDHTPEELKQLILKSAEKIIYSKGLNGLTARALAEAIGYAPGTIYNFYRDMEALVSDVNYETLGRLQAFCYERIKDLPPDFSKIGALAYAYVDFARENTRAWETLFANTHKVEKKARVPKHYQQRLLGVFQLIEATLQECLEIPVADAPKTARLLWACLHGITILMLDGRLTLIGVERPHEMIDDLLRKYFSSFRPASS